jgi:hypothetical protein
VGSIEAVPEVLAEGAGQRRCVCGRIKPLPRSVVPACLRIADLDGIKRATPACAQTWIERGSYGERPRLCNRGSKG